MAMADDDGVFDLVVFSVGDGKRGGDGCDDDGDVPCDERFGGIDGAGRDRKKEGGERGGFFSFWECLGDGMRVCATLNDAFLRTPFFP